MPAIAVRRRRWERNRGWPWAGSGLRVGLFVVGLLLTAAPAMASRQDGLSRDPGATLVPGRTAVVHVVGPDEAPRFVVGAAQPAPPTIEVDPTAAPPGTSVAISGEGWLIRSVEPGEPDAPPSSDEFTATFGNLPMNAEFEVDDDGSLDGRGEIPENALGGVARILVCAESVGCDEMFFTVRPRISVSQAAGVPGTTVTVTGSGFESVDPPREWEIRLRPEEAAIGSAFVGPAGTLEGTATIPLGAAEGPTTIAACLFDVDSGDVCHEASFEVTRPSLGIDPTEGRPADLLDVSGEGWCCAGTPGTVVDETTDVAWGGVEVDESGDLRGEATVPLDQPAGPVDLTVCVATCGTVQVTVLEAESTTTDATVAPSTTVTFVTTTTTPDPDDDACDVEPGSLAVEPESGLAGSEIEVSLTVGQDSPEGCLLTLLLGGSPVGEPFSTQPGAESIVVGVVPSGIAIGRNALDVVDRASGRVVASTVFEVGAVAASDGDGFPWDLAAAATILLLLVAGIAGMTRRSRRRHPDPGPLPVVSAAEVWPALRVPAHVEAGRPFRAYLELGTLDGTPLPALGADAELIADGYDLHGGTRHRVAVGGTGAASIPIDLVADPVDGAVLRRIVAHLYRDGHLVGWAQSSPVVFPAGSGLQEAGMAPAAAVPLGTPDGPPPDLTLTITRGDNERFLLWGFGTPHPISLPATEVRSDLGKENARTFAHDEVLGLAATDPDLVGMQLKGVAAQIGGRIPAAAWQVMRDVAPYAAAAGRPPVVLIVSEETYVPWELAAVPGELVGDKGAPGLLGAQMVIGRWMPPDAADGLHPDHPRLPPAARLDVESMAVVVHAGGGGAAPPLPFARQEADTLGATYGAMTIPASTGAVAALLELRHLVDGRVSAPSVLHLACHGTVDPDHPARSGIVLLSAQGAWVPLTPSMLRGSALLPASRPLLFINACSTGTPQDALDGFGGLIGAALKSGARGVVAPLWNIDDRPAHDSAMAVYSGALEEGAAIGDALRRVRAEATRSERIERSYLAYVFYGHPWLLLTRSIAATVAPAARAEDEPVR